MRKLEQEFNNRKNLPEQNLSSRSNLWPSDMANVYLIKSAGFGHVFSYIHMGPNKIVFDGGSTSVTYGQDRTEDTLPRTSFQKVLLWIV